MNLSIVNGVAKAMPPHVEAEFRRNGDELIEIWVNKGVSHHLVRRCADDIIIMAQMAYWKVKRSKDEIGDDDDTNGQGQLPSRTTWRATLAHTTTEIYSLIDVHSNTEMK
jgi:hypothetical protein